MLGLSQLCYFIFFKGDIKTAPLKNNSSIPSKRIKIKQLNWNYRWSFLRVHSLFPIFCLWKSIKVDTKICQKRLFLLCNLNIITVKESMQISHRTIHFYFHLIFCELMFCSVILCPTTFFYISHIWSSSSTVFIM